MDVLAYSLAVGLASAAAWRLLALDELTASIRRILPRDFVRRWLLCPWCAGFWVAAAITIAADFILEDGIPAPLLVLAAARYVVGWVGERDSALFHTESDDAS